MSLSCVAVDVQLEYGASAYYRASGGAAVVLGFQIQSASFIMLAALF